MTPINTYENKLRTGFPSTKIDKVLLVSCPWKIFSVTAPGNDCPKKWQRRNFIGKHQHPITINYKALYLVTAFKICSSTPLYYQRQCEVHSQAP